VAECFFLADVTTVEVAVLIEMIMNQGVRGGEFPLSFNVPMDFLCGNATKKRFRRSGIFSLTTPLFAVNLAA
jgi:hypothetical protein